MEVGKTKDQGLYTSAEVHPRALAAGTLPQYNTTYYHSKAKAIVFFSLLTMT